MFVIDVNNISIIIVMSLEPTQNGKRGGAYQVSKGKVTACRVNNTDQISR